ETPLMRKLFSDWGDEEKQPDVFRNLGFSSKRIMDLVPIPPASDKGIKRKNSTLFGKVFVWINNHHGFQLLIDMGDYRVMPRFTVINVVGSFFFLRIIE